MQYGQKSRVSDPMTQKPRFFPKRLRPSIVMLSPAGVGGMATFAENCRKYWNSREYELRLIRVPRHSLGGWLSYPFVLLRFFFILVNRRPSLVHINLASRGSPVRKLPFALLCRLVKVSHVLQIHSGSIDKDLKSPNSKKLWKHIVSNLFRHADGALFLNHAQMNEFTEIGYFRKEQVSFLPNHIFIPEVQVGFKKIHDLVFIGRFSVEKGAIDFYKSLLELRFDSDLHVAVVGENSIADYIESSPTLPGNIKVKFYGEVANDAAMQILMASKLLVLPSYTENYPMVILEAFARAIPVVATDVGSVTLLVKDGVTGRVVRAGDFLGLAKAMEQLLSNPLDLQNCGLRARALVEMNLDATHYSRKLIETYVSIGLLAVAHR